MGLAVVQRVGRRKKGSHGDTEAQRKKGRREQGRNFEEVNSAV
jgi:hypothetical protein